MTERVRVTKEVAERASDTPAATPAKAARPPQAEKTLAETDELLDAIDEALQGLEEDLAVNYRQQGGQ